MTVTDTNPPLDELSEARQRIEVLTAQRNRLMGENQGLIHQVKLLSERFTNITEPASGRRVSEPAESRPRAASAATPVARKPTPTKPVVEGLDL